MKTCLCLPLLVVVVFLILGLKTESEPSRILLVLHKLSDHLAYYDVETGRELASVPTAAFPHEMCLSPDRKTLYITEYGCRGVEAPGQGGNTIAVFDVKSKKRIATISTGDYNRPHGIVARNGKLFVTSEPTQRLLVFDLQTHSLLQAISTEQLISHLVNVSPDGKTAYTTNIGSNSITAIDLANGKIVKHLSLLTRPEGLVFSPDGKLMYVVNRESAAVSVVDTLTKEQVGLIRTGKGPVRITISPDGKRIIFPLFHSDAVQIADTQTLKVTQTIPVGRQPVGMALSPDGKLVFVSCELDQTVFVISLETSQVIRKIKTGVGPDSMVCMFASELQ